MKLRMVLLGVSAVAMLAACGDDSGGEGGAGGSGATTGASTTAQGGTTTGGTTTGGTTTGGEGGDGPGTTTGAGGEGGGTGGEGGGGTAYDCASYCETITAACTGENRQYPDAASCLAGCSGFEVGEYQDADSTLGCRAYHATAAEADPALHCIHAGPLGLGACGDDPCDGFCRFTVEACGELSSYADVDTCLKVCSAFAVGDYSVESPSADDDLACRMYHASVAAQSGGANAELHCPHANAVSDTCN